MPRKHRDSSTGMNLQWSRANEELDERPIVDRQLEREADRMGMAHVRYGHYGKGPKGYRRSDESIREEVCEALYRSHNVDASDMEVEVYQGVVYLRGQVYDRHMKRTAEETVENISGVTDIHNLLNFPVKLI